MRLKKNLIPIFVLVIAVAVFMVALNTGPDDDKTEEYIKMIEDQGARNAYESFKQIMETVSVPQQHSAAHVFGFALYAVSGVNGIEVCDSSFSYGCYHSHISAAIVDKGVEVVEKLNSHCKQASQPVGCQHGIGHGLLGYYGYDENGVRDSLDTCNEVEEAGTLLGCFSGVFMEYNLGTMLEAGGWDGYQRQAGADLYEPCSSLDDRYLPACYAEQPSWWEKTLGWDFVKLVDMCEGISQPRYIENCFNPLSGGLVVRHGFDASRIVSECDKLGTNRKDSCLARTAGTFYSLNGSKSVAKEICSASSDKPKCLSKAHLNY